VWRAIITFVVVAGAFGLAVSSSVTLGLDLKGGTQIILQTQDTKRVKADADATDRALQVLRGRVDALGVAEPTLARSGEDRIIVELPGLQDPRKAAEVIGKTAQLTFHEVLAPASEKEAKQAKQNSGDNQNSGKDGNKKGNKNGDKNGNGDNSEDGDEADVSLPQDNNGDIILPDEDGTPLKLAPAGLDGNGVDDAEAATPEDSLGEWVVNVDFNSEGRPGWKKLVETACGNQEGNQRIAIVLDEKVISSPAIQPELCQSGGGNSTMISGNFTQSSADDLAVLIKGGALPVPVKVISQRTIGPTLGSSAIDASIKASVIGIVMTGLFIVFVYRLVGVMATIALGAYALLAYAMLVWLGATLTLPGLAGFVLAIGLAIDANVLVFERAREEYAAGKKAESSLTSSLDTGYSKAWSAILDSNVTTLLAALLLFFLASGPVKGFGVTLSIGVIASMVSALIIARVLTEWLAKRAFSRRHPQISGVAGTGPVRRWLTEHGPQLMRKSGTWVIVTGVIAVVCIGGIVVRGFNLGVEFTGGRVLEYSADQPIDVSDARDAVSNAGFSQAVVQRSSSDSGPDNVSIRLGQVSNQQAVQVQKALESEFGPVDKVSDELIGPSLGQELRNKALLAFVIAIGAQMLYLAWRFRWTFALAAVTSLASVVLTVVGVFAWWGKPIDGVFLAAILSIIGLAVNDTIVVFDRIREDTGLQRIKNLRGVVNQAILDTLPRTVNTWVSAAFILAALGILGGDSLTDFAIALLIGLTFGMFSTVFTASSIAVLLEERWPFDPEKAAQKPSADPYAHIPTVNRDTST